jgi:hypothetical protein
VTDFDDRGAEPWIQLVKAQGIALERRTAERGDPEVKGDVAPRWADVPEDQRFRGTVQLECGHDFPVLLLHEPVIGEVCRCPRCRADHPVASVHADKS